MTDDDPATFFLTDFLARNFDRLVIRGLGLDRHPELLPTYFGNYHRLVYLAQTDDPALVAVRASRRPAARPGVRGPPDGLRRPRRVGDRRGRAAPRRARGAPRGSLHRMQATSPGARCVRPIAGDSLHPEQGLRRLADGGRRNVAPAATNPGCRRWVATFLAPGATRRRFLARAAILVDDKARAAALRAAWPRAARLRRSDGRVRGDARPLRRRLAMPPILSVIWWRDIPAQVVAKDARRSSKVVLHPRFQVAIDKAANRAGKRAYNDYIAEWRKTQRAVRRRPRGRGPRRVGAARGRVRPSTTWPS